MNLRYLLAFALGVAAMFGAKEVGEYREAKRWEALARGNYVLKTSDAADSAFQPVADYTIRDDGAEMRIRPDLMPSGSTLCLETKDNNPGNPAQCWPIKEAVDNLTRRCMWIEGEHPKIGVLTCGSPGTESFTVVGTFTRSSGESGPAK